MNEKEVVQLSKFLSLVLRHQPGKVGIALDEAGWVDVAELLAAMGRHGRAVSRAELLHVVETSDKKRFALSDDGRRIRASQGHSVEVELGYEPATPLDVLFHGTVERFLDSIRAKGLVKGNGITCT
jgi:putative RNA 2'-phosphotransferase